MGIHVENVTPGAHAHDGIFQGFTLTIHRGDQDVNEVSGNATRAAFSRLVQVAKTAEATDAMMDVAGAACWGADWWGTWVVQRGNREAVKEALRQGWSSP